MAAVLHGTGSLRQQQQQQQQQHHHNSISISGTGNGCLTGGVLQNSQAATPIYSNMPKYSRIVVQSQQQQQSQITAPNHHHSVYGANNAAGAGPPPVHQYNPPLPSIPSYFSQQQQHQQHSLQQSYATTQRSSSQDVAACRNYWGHSPHSATMMYRSGGGGRHHSKRKSAVELLAETKPFFIKSDAVLERLHQSKTSYRSASAAMSMLPTGSSGKRGRNGVDNRNDDDGRCKSSYGGELDFERRYAPHSSHLHQGSGSSSRDRVGSTHLHHHHSHTHSHSHVGGSGGGGRHTMQGSRDQKLRMMFGGGSELVSRDRNSRVNSNDRYRNKFNFGGSKLIGSGTHSQEFSSVGFSCEDDALINIPPPSFLSPQSFDNAYNAYGGAENSSGDEPLVLTENYRPISPPAEYAAEAPHSRMHDSNDQHSRYNYQRSYSHSHEMAAEHAAKYADADYNINSHKSLPDLHSQISRHSPHSEILSCCSRGNRSIKSAGESSLNRDSGGSSGHYTHRSEPCYRQPRESEREIYCGNKNCCNPVSGVSGGGCVGVGSGGGVTPMEYRRDSGSSTQHSANSYCGYASPSYAATRTATECVECRCKPVAHHFESPDYLLNFTTPEVPEAFQDDYTPPSPSVHNKYKNTDEPPRYSSGYSSGGAGVKHHSQNSHPIVQSPGSAPSIEDISPPPIQFKRQRCIRFKNRSRISLPPSNVHNSSMNEIGGSGNGNGTGGEKYHSRGALVSEQPTFFFPKCFSADGYQTGPDKSFASDMDHMREPEGLSDLEKFFDRLGLNDDKFHEIYNPIKRRRSAETESDDSSTVFFSDVSTVDSMRLPDSTETQPAVTQAYRPSEPPSIVERNARIIKWLCNCRKLQYI